MKRTYRLSALSTSTFLAALLPSRLAAFSSTIEKFFNIVYNRDVLDKFSENENGMLLYNGKKIISDFSLDSLPTFGIGGNANG